MQCLEYSTVQVCCNVHIGTSVFTVLWLIFELGAFRYLTVSMLRSLIIGMLSVCLANIVLRHVLVEDLEVLRQPICLIGSSSNLYP
jgi:hypothetical protein